MLVIIADFSRIKLHLIHVINKALKYFLKGFSAFLEFFSAQREKEEFQSTQAYGLF